MKRTVLLLVTLLLFHACISDKTPKKEEPKREENTTKEPTEEPKKENNDTKVPIEEPLSMGSVDMELKESLELYLNQLKSLDGESIISMTYPKLFMATSKYLYKGAIFTMANSSNVNIISFDTNISNIGVIQPFSEGNFTNVSYTSVIEIQFVNPDLYNTQLSLNTLHSVLARKYGSDNIYVDKEQRTIKISKEEKMLAIKEKPYGWKFVGDNPAYRKLYPNFLPQDILNQI